LELSEDSSDKDAALFVTLVTDYLVSAFTFLFLDSSIDFFLDSASDEDEDDDATVFC
jgi:hypothetical protein